MEGEKNVEARRRPGIVERDPGLERRERARDPVVELVEVTPQQSGAVSGMANIVATSSLLALVALVAVRRRQAMQRRDYTTLETVV